MENKKLQNKKIYILMKFIICSFLAVLFSVPAFAFEDCVVTTNGRLNDIKIQHNNIIDVFPLVTLSNEKNILIIHPLKSGSTKFTVLRNNKEKILFNVNVTEYKTTVEEVKGFDILSIDCPPSINGYEYYFDLDEPPEFGSTNKIRNEAQEYKDFIDNIDSPPKLRGIEL